MKISFCLNPALSSILTLLSHTLIFPSISTPKGLISTRVASFYIKHLYSFETTSLISFVLYSVNSKHCAILSRISEGMVADGGKKNL